MDVIDHISQTFNFRVQQGPTLSLVYERTTGNTEWLHISDSSGMPLHSATLDDDRRFEMTKLSWVMGGVIPLILVQFRYGDDAIKHTRVDLARGLHWMFMMIRPSGLRSKDRFRIS